MPFIGNQPTAVPLTGADLTDGIITSAKIADGTIVGDDINSTFDLTGKTVTGAGESNVPAFSAYGSGDQGFADSAWVKVTVNNEEFDTDNAYDNTTNYRFTVPAGQGGKYFFFGRLNIDTSSNTAGGYDNHLSLYKNGSLYTKQQQRWIGYPQRNPGVNISATLSLNAGDYIELYVWCDDGQNSPNRDDDGGNKQCWFSGYKVST